MDEPCIIFDMDGPLTKSRETISFETVDALHRHFGRARLVLVSGASLEQISKQLGSAIELFSEVHPNCGNAGKQVWRFRRDIIESDLVMLSDWRGEVSGPTIEWREGAFNFAACGQNASGSLRQEYSDWDTDVEDRLRMASILEQLHPEIQVTIGGRVSLDVTMRGEGKEQVDVPPGSLFFCDSLGPHGGDEKLARKVLESGGTVVYSRSPETTVRHLSLG